MKEKSLILYGCPVKLTNAHKLVTGHGQPAYYVRADQFNGGISEALEKAEPIVAQPGADNAKYGETVLNTVPIQ